MFSERQYPSFLAGPGYLMSRSTARRLLAASPAVPVFHLEDVYITGLLARKAGIRPVNRHGFSGEERPEVAACLPRSLVTAHRIRPHEMAGIHGGPACGTEAAARRQTADNVLILAYGRWVA